MTQTLTDVYLAARRTLLHAGVEAAELEAREIASVAAGVSREDFACWGYHFVGDETACKVQALLARRLQGEPLAYLLGEWDFYGHTFVVSPDVLIPRPDTERLVELAIDSATHLHAPRILDVCCGSGCIGISLLCAREDARGVALDISPEALSITKENARRLSVSERLTTLQGDALQKPSPHLGRFHVMTANPPYITAEEMRQLDKSVKAYEPVLALYGGEDGLDFYRSLAQNWQEVLMPEGILWTEIGYAQGQVVAGLFTENGWQEVAVYQDYAGQDRVVKAVAPKEIELLPVCNHLANVSASTYNTEIEPSTDGIVASIMESRI